MGTVESKIKVSIGLIAGGLFLFIIQDEPNGGSVTGISNMGNTCFLNAILQALSACDSFTKFLFALKPVQKNYEDYDALIVIELSNFLRSLTQGKNTNPEDLISALSNRFPYFGQQHDSHEIFYVIHEAMATIKKRSENSFIFDPAPENPLLGLMSTEIKCTKCLNKTTKFDSIFDISLIVSNSLCESFDYLHKPQVLEDFLCLKCSINSSIHAIRSMKSTQMLNEILKKYTNNPNNVEEKDLVKTTKTLATISNRICKFPILLFIHCKWLVSHSSGHIHKKREPMKFPHIFEVEKGRYTLKAVIEHIGGSMGGHYLTYKDFEGEWYQCSDLAVRKVTVQEVLMAQPYMLFYQLTR
ncbi:hypothetical protein SteCoe_2714 [Stentor coeruleus]|uniref:ubiquitinyl hydrolase 1 n=1 Tax=Stentor coeruleus TaxID=5963 RepID=A0A1R2CYY8_9CILI|nr:hypothetical protein SteCoe_2714 [Stentor coeruleus]